MCEARQTPSAVRCVLFRPVLLHSIYDSRQLFRIRKINSRFTNFLSTLRVPSPFLSLSFSIASNYYDYVYVIVNKTLCYFINSPSYIVWNNKIQSFILCCCWCCWWCSCSRSTALHTMDGLMWRCVRKSVSIFCVYLIWLAAVQILNSKCVRSERRHCSFGETLLN